MENPVDRHDNVLESWISPAVQLAIKAKAIPPVNLLPRDEHNGSMCTCNDAASPYGEDSCLGQEESDKART